MLDATPLPDPADVLAGARFVADLAATAFFAEPFFVGVPRSGEVVRRR